jgi:membrane protein DedA with SNARE-associated domain
MAATTPPSPGGLGPDEGWMLSSDERRVARLALTALGVLSAGSMLGVAFSFYLVNHQPLLLVGLSPLGRHLWLVAPIVDPVPLVVVLVVRRMLFYTASFYLGRALGPQGILWVEARAARFGRFVRWIERLFGRASHVVVFSMTGPTVSALAGISGMRVAVFAALASAGLVARTVVVILLAEEVREYIEAVLAWIDSYWIPGTVLMVAGVAAYRWKVRGRLPSVEA